MAPQDEAPRTPSAPRSLTERIMVLALVVTVMDTLYLCWRFIALHRGWGSPGTGLCSWSTWIDCDQVLLSPEARAFYVPNALLGLGFFAGCLLWWLRGTRTLDPCYRHHLIRTLAFWLGIATLFTLRFWQLLLGLDHLCPFCPWNHLFTWIAFGAAIQLWRRTPKPTSSHASKPLAAHVAICVAPLFALLLAWELLGSVP